MENNNLPQNDNDENKYLSEEIGEKQADNAAKEVFGSEENVQKTAGIIKSFVVSYEENKNKMEIGEWLVKEFGKYPKIWKNKTDLQNTAKETIDTVKSLNKTKEEFYAHIDSGKSKESFMEKKIEEGAKAAGVVNVGQYAANIDRTLQEGNLAMLQTVTNKNGNINMIPNLDGFIAEQHHVNTFNADAVTKGISLRAEVLKPEPGKLYSPDSLDIQIKDTTTGKVVKRYQAKYGKDSEATLKEFAKGDYRGQTKLVPKGQGKDIEGAVEKIEAGGVESKSLSKEEAKAIQEKAQIERETKEYKWDDINKTSIVKGIGKQALVSAGLTAAFQGGRILGRRVWNFVCGKENKPLSEDMVEFFESSIKSAGNVGIQTAVSGGVIVAARNGWVKILKNTPAGMIVQTVYLGIENAKIMYKVFKGELSVAEGLDAMGNLLYSTTYGIAGGVVGGEVGAIAGAAIGSVIPIVGTAVGAVVGGVVGAVAGGIAGSAVGEGIYKVGKAIVKAGWETVKSVCSAVGSVVSSVGNAISSLGSWVSSWF